MTLRFRLLTLARAACGGAALLALVARSAGDVLVLANGDRLTGKVVKREDGKITFHTDLLGDIVAPETAVTIIPSVPTATATVTPPPNGGSTPAGEATMSASTPAAPPTAASPTSNGAAATADSLAGLPPGASAKPVAAAHGPPPTPPVDVHTPTKAAWTGKVEFGYDNEETNVRTVNTTFRAEADRTIGKDDFLIKVRYLYGKTGELPTTDREDAEFRYRYNLSDRLFAQSDSTANSDKIRNIHFETDENVGMGYKILKTTRQTIDVGTGVTAEYLNAVGIQRGFSYLLNVFQDYTYKINGRYTFSEDASARYAPEKQGRFVLSPDQSVEISTSNREYAYKFHSTLQGKISNHLSLNLHYEYEFDNAVIDPTARAEQRVTTTLGYGF